MMDISHLEGRDDEKHGCRWKSMHMFRDWGSQRKGTAFWRMETVVGSCSGQQKVCVSVRAGLKDMMEWILAVREETNPQNALHGAIGNCELNVPLFKFCQHI